MAILHDGLYRHERWVISEAKIFIYTIAISNASASAITIIMATATATALPMTTAVIVEIFV